MGTEAPFLSRPIPSPEPNLIKSHKNALQNSLTNSNKTEPRDSPHNKKKPFTPVSLEERNWFSRGVSLGIRRIEGLIENGRVTLT